jgi:hypothetical protein
MCWSKIAGPPPELDASFQDFITGDMMLDGMAMDGWLDGDIGGDAIEPAPQAARPLTTQDRSAQAVPDFLSRSWVLFCVYARHAAVSGGRVALRLTLRRHGRAGRCCIASIPTRRRADRSP